MTDHSELQSKLNDSRLLQQDACIMIRQLEETVIDQALEIKQQAERLRVLQNRLADRPKAAFLR